MNLTKQCPGCGQNLGLNYYYKPGGGSLWAGTISIQILDWLKITKPLKVGNFWEILAILFQTTGCEVFRYNGTNVTPVVNDDGGEIGSGFGDTKNFIARYSIEYPEGSGNIIVGTVQGDMMVCEREWKGCSVWMRHD